MTAAAVPVLALDVDGAVSPLAPAGTWTDFAPSPRSRLELLLSAQMGAALGALPARRVWVTDWETSANTLIGAVFGWPELPVLRRPPSTAGEEPGTWWKVTALQAWRPRRGAPLVWVDDQLGAHPEAAAWAARLPTPSLLLAPDPLIGVTADHIETIAAFLAEHATP